MIAALLKHLLKALFYANLGPSGVFAAFQQRPQQGVSHLNDLGGS